MLIISQTCSVCKLAGFEERDLLKETLSKRVAEIEILKQENVELREQVQLTEQLNE